MFGLVKQLFASVKFSSIKKSFISKKHFYSTMYKSYACMTLSE